MAEEAKNDGAKAVPPKSSSSNKTLIIVLAIVGIFVILPAIAISVGVFWLSRGDNTANLTEKIVESATGADIDIDKDGNSVSIKTEEGSVSIGTEQEIPKELPDAVVIYENRTVTGVYTSSQEDGSQWNITIETDDDISEVSDSVATKYAEKGWKTVSKSSYNGAEVYSFEKDNLTSYVTISTNTENNKTILSYSVTETKNNQ